MSILQNMKTPKTSQPKGKVRHSRVKYGKNGGLFKPLRRKNERVNSWFLCFFLLIKKEK